MEKRVDFLAIAELKRGQEEEKKKNMHSFLFADLVSEASGAFSDTHKHSKHNTHVIDATESKRH